MQLVNVVPLSQRPIVREACYASGLCQMGRLRVGRVQLDTMGEHHVEQPGIVEAMVAYLSFGIEKNQVHDVSSEFMNLFVLGIFEHIWINLWPSVKAPTQDSMIQKNPGAGIFLYSVL